MKASLFERGLAPRLAAVAIYGTLACATVAWLEPSAAVPIAASGTATTVPSGVPAVLCIESVLPVGHWEVRVDGRVVSARLAQPGLWLGDATLQQDSSLVIDAQPASEARADANSLRIRIAGTAVSRDHVAWCGRDWSVALPIKDLARASALIDAGDLP